MIKAAICTNCEKAFTFNTNTGSTGKFCTHACFRAYASKNMKYKYIMVNGRRQAIYPITCLHCGASKDAYRKTAKYCSAKCQLAYEYSQGTRDRATIALAAHESIRRNGNPKARGVPKPKTAEACAAISRGKLGKQVPKLQGTNHWAWAGGKDKSIWKTPRYQAWRKAVMRRDNFTCVLCGDNRGGNLEADHIKPRMLYPELTFDIGNGRTLCKPCHKTTPTHGQKVRALYAIRSSLIIATLASL